MPPKKRGDNVKGRDKIFRNAVQHVHVGMGHNVLGNLTLQPITAHGGDTDDECAFLLELNEQMLSHTSTDFKGFRWEVLQLCESKALFNLNHRKIAQIFLLALMRRDKNAEGYEAFVRLTVAFARDTREKFLTYFECFHQAVNSGILDANGHLIADTRRLQLVFAAQAAWCRELAPFWTRPEHHKLVERIIRLYVRQMHDSKEYIRRLSAEVLAVICRMVPSLLPAIVREACMDAVKDFDTFCRERLDNEEVEGVDFNDEAEELNAKYKTDNVDEEGDDEREEKKPQTATEEEWIDITNPLYRKAHTNAAELINKYEQEHLPNVPVVDGLSFLCAELFRGIRGALNTHFEDHYALLLYAFGLSQGKPFTAVYCSGHGVDTHEAFGVSEEETRQLVPCSRWISLFGENTTDGKHKVQSEIVQVVGAAAMGEALRVVMGETMNTGTDADVLPSHRLLSALASTVTFSAPHIRLTAALMHSGNGMLLRDVKAAVHFRRATSEILRGLQASRKAMIKRDSKSAVEANDDEHDDVVVDDDHDWEWLLVLRSCAALLESAAPLSIGLRNATAATYDAFLPLCVEAVSLCVEASHRESSSSRSSSNENRTNKDGSYIAHGPEAEMILFAFAQDVLQKHYAHCLREERRLAEEVHESADGSVSMAITSFGFALLRPILTAACDAANESMRAGRLLFPLRSVQHATLLARMMDERTAHVSGSALEKILCHSSGESSSVLSFVIGAITALINAQDSTNDRAIALWTDAVGAILPIVVTIDSARGIGKVEKSKFMKDLRSGLRQVMGGVSSSAASASRALFAQAAALLVQLSTKDTKNRKKGEEEREEEEEECSRHTVEEVCAGHLREAIVLLGAGFDNAHGTVRSDDEMARLFHGTECLLLSLLRLGGSEQYNVSHAVDTICRLLDTKSQQILVESLLLESLAAPVQSLRVLGLRFLRTLCDPAAKVRVTGSSSVSPVVFDALLNAELFNPLSTTGNLDGIRQALAKMSFEAAAQTIKDPLQRVIVARAMIGLLHVKFADAWPIALKILADLVRSEDTSANGIERLRSGISNDKQGNTRNNDDADEEDDDLNHDHDDDSKADHSVVTRQKQRREKLEPIVWTTVMCRYARVLVFGDVICRSKSKTLVSPTDDVDEVSSNAESDADMGVDNKDEDVENVQDRRGKRRGANHVLVWYRIRLDDAQRHEKGELVSKDFSATRYATSSVTLLELANEVGVVLSWNTHYIPSASPVRTHGVLVARATDRAVLAKTFLSGLADMTRGAPLHSDGRARLVEDMVLELASIRRGEHPDGLRELKQLDDRLVLAMQACAGAPPPVKVERLKVFLTGFVSDPNAKLQRAAVENLKRLKVQPFVRYHAQLVPFCDTEANLFRFLSSFHVETDVAQEDHANYVATALTLALPKLTAKVTKDKMKDQAVLQRRVLAFLTHIMTSDKFALVLEGLVQRLVFERVMPSSDGIQLEDFRFLTRWSEWVAHDSHSTRRLERLLKQLQSTIQLLIVLLYSVGRGFAPFTSTCLHLALNAYLVSCRQYLRDPLVAALAKTKEGAMEEIEQQASRALHTMSFNALLPKLRRISASLAVLLFEQFPEEVMDTLRLDLSTMRGNLEESLMHRYVTALVVNSKGATRDILLTSGRAGDAQSHLSPTMPLQRLVGAWVASPVTMPLVAAFGDAVIVMLQQVFSLTSSSGVVRQQHEQKQRQHQQRIPQSVVISVYEGLRCVTAILAAGEESIVPFGQQEKKSRRNASHTLRKLFIEPHVVHVFESLYRLIMRGAGTTGAEADVEAATFGEKSSLQSVKKTRDAHSSGSSTSSSFLSVFSLAMWKEMIGTVTLLAEYIVTEDKAKTVPMDKETKELTPTGGVHVMLSRLLEMCIAFVSHPVCARDKPTCVTATDVLVRLFPRLPRVQRDRHFMPLVHLMNIVTSPEARLALCRALVIAMPRVEKGKDQMDGVCYGSSGHMAQIAAVGRAVTCMNSFADANTDMSQYNFELRYHTFRTLQRFFAGDGSSSAMKTRQISVARQGHVRQERDYSGDHDVMIPLDADDVPVLCADGFLALAANVVFYLRDYEGTIRAVASQLLTAMMAYAARQDNRVPSYSMWILTSVVRREVLPSLRRGVVSRDVHIRHQHMQCFAALAHYYPTHFPSFAALFSRNTEQSFFANVGHVQHRCRLNALAMLRRAVGRLLPRDVLRVFVPFLLAAVRDYAQGRRDLQNLTEGRAKGYCGAVLETLAALAAALPWEGYYRVLSLLLLNARENVSLRLPMLRGVVMLLDHFHFLDDEGKDVGTTVGSGESVKDKLGDNNNNNEDDDDDDDDDDDILGEEDPQNETDAKNKDTNNSSIKAAALLRIKRMKYKHARVMHVLEDDILPQLYEFVGDGSRKNNAVGGDLRGTNVHSITRVRGDMQKSDKAQQSTAILQLPVAIAITKIVKRFPSDRFSQHVEHLLDEIILKLRTKNDRQRESARRILSAMLCEVGPGKLSFVIRKLKDHLVHGYQLHVLGYTVVTMLYNLYEPKHAISYGQQKRTHRSVTDSSDTVKRTRKESRLPEGDKSKKVDYKGKGETEEDEEEKDDNEEEDEEEVLARELKSSLTFDHAYGVSCLSSCLDELMSIFLDDYLGEVGEQKEQVELMSTMIEVKRNRALQGFTLIASHCQAERVIETFLHKITWLLTPPSDAANVDITQLRGSARAGAFLIQELKSKYSTTSKNAAADLIFVQKVRLLAVRVARALMTNPTMQVESSFCTVRDLLRRHNEVREEKIRTFEAKDGTRRIRGNAHIIIQSAPKTSLKEQMAANFLVAPRPERVDVDFSAHTVLATQQKQKLRSYRGRYGREVERAARDFYREDPTAAVVLDTLDEFLLMYLLSVLKQVLGVGKERKYSTAAVRLDLVREGKKHNTNNNTKKKQSQRRSGEEEEDCDNNGEEINANEDEQMKEGDTNERVNEDVNNDAGDEEEEEEEDDGRAEELDPQELDDEEGDELDRLDDESQEGDNHSNDNKQKHGTAKELPTSTHRKVRPMSDLTASFTRQHQTLLESLIPVVLTTLEGEGSDAVVGNALDCLLALVSLRPPLHAVGELHDALFRTVTAFFARGAAIKQRAMRAAAAVVSHQRFVLSDERASQLVRLCHAELVERNEFVPMALSLFYAVLGKHSHVTEVYDLIGVVTELMMHMSSKRLLRQRCVSSLVRFLTEYRMTPEKFRSHIDLICRNLDYPEVTGRIALLELMDLLSFRLPTEVLRHEAPLLFIPLAVTLTAAEFREARQKAGDVMCHLVQNAGIDVIAPTLADWLADGQTRAKKATALQAWALLIPAVAAAYDLSGTSSTDAHDTAHTDGEDEMHTENIEAFWSCCVWSIRAVLDAATFDQIAASGTRRNHEELSAPARQKLELRGWTYVFYGLRCVEAIVKVLPMRMWCEVFAAELIPCIRGRLVHHAHPWIQSVALRLLRMYCHSAVEPRCGYFTAIAPWTMELRASDDKDNDKNPDDDDDKHDTPQALQKKAKRKANKKEKAIKSQASHTGSVPQDGAEESPALPYMLQFNRPGPVDTISRAITVLDEISATLRSLIQYFGTTDVPNEKYTAHRAMMNPARGDAVGAALYLTRAMAVASVALLVAASVSSVKSVNVQCKKVISQHFGSLCRQLHALATPVLRHNSVTNVMVRTASLVQYMGGFLSTVPELEEENTNNNNDNNNTNNEGGDEDGDEEEDRNGNENDERRLQCSEAVRWILCEAIGLSFLKVTVAPTVAIVMRCGDRSEKLSTMASQASLMIREQLEARRADFTESAQPVMGKTGKRPRDSKDSAVALTCDDVLFAMSCEETAMKSSKRDAATKKDTLKMIRKRQRTEVGEW